MTPSGWHDDARGRDAGHDDMQIAVFDYLRDRSAKVEGFERLGIWFEYPFVSRGKVIAWGDIVEVWGETSTDRSGPPRKFRILEIKPKIYSVGGVVRQCLALEEAARYALPRRRDGRTEDVRAIPLVPPDDPKLSALRHVFHAITWDGRTMA